MRKKSIVESDLLVEYLQNTLWARAHCVILYRKKGNKYKSCSLSICRGARSLLLQLIDSPHTSCVYYCICHFPSINDMLRTYSEGSF